MGRKRRITCNKAGIEPLNLVTFDTLFSPTIDMASELINVPNNVIEKWLKEEAISLVGQGNLTKEAIEFLAKKYVERLHRYYDNCVNRWNSLDAKDRDLFNQFKRRYSKFYRFWDNKWSGIDIDRIIKDFKKELSVKSFNAACSEFECFEFPELVYDKDRHSTAGLYYTMQNAKRDSLLLYTISHNLYFGSRIKTKIPTRPEYRSIVLEVLFENRFHIFTFDPDSNGQTEVTFCFPHVKQPRLAIASVFGYLRHKNPSS